MPSLGLKAVRAPERITRLSSVHLAALNKVHLCGIWRRDCLPFALFARSLHTMEATTRSDKCPIRLCCLAGSWQSRWWERTASVGSCPSAAAGSASSVAQMLGGWGVGGASLAIQTSCQQPVFPAISGGMLGWLMPRHSPEEDFCGCGWCDGCIFQMFER